MHKATSSQSSHGRCTGETELSLRTIILPNLLHNWSLQLFSQDYNLVSHNTHVLHVKSRELQFNVYAKRQIWETSHDFWQKSVEGNIFSYFFSVRNVWARSWTTGLWFDRPHSVMHLKNKDSRFKTNQTISVFGTVRRMHIKQLPRNQVMTAVKRESKLSCAGDYRA